MAGRAGRQHSSICGKRPLVTGGGSERRRGGSYIPRVGYCVSFSQVQAEVDLVRAAVEPCTSDSRGMLL